MKGRVNALVMDVLDAGKPRGNLELLWGQFREEELHLDVLAVE